tara:strand:- start:1852 stop:2103 length:252 start_codon:yes stop_codon:yes gene_type:complete
VKIFYFSWVREKVGISNEDFSLPQHVTNIEQLAKFLQSKGGGYSDAFADLSVIKAAVNREHVKLDCAISENDEVAFFPPVTGG